jgi:hypothetical protein
MMRDFRVYLFLSAAVLWLAATSSVHAEIVVDHQPFPTGGPASDTDLLIDGQPFWQQNADDFMLAQPATIRHITWFGFYGSSFTSPAEQPPATQTFRMRLYDARPLVGLPGNIVHEENFVDPTLAATGRQILVGALPDEYKFDADLAAPLSLLPSTPYWLEIVQLGSRGSFYRWENSVAEIDGHAFLNPITVDWRHTQNVTTDLAFQLSTVPEPTSAMLFSVVCFYFITSGGRKGRHHDSRKVHLTSRPVSISRMSGSRSPHSAAEISA